MLNKVTLIGNLGADPEVRYMPNGGAVTNVTIATTARWKDKQSGERRDNTEWHRVVFFSRLAEIVGEYLRKGSQIYIEGRLQTRKWQGKDGLDRYTTEIIASEMNMLGSRSGGTANFNNQDQAGGSNSDQQNSGEQPQKAQQQQQAPVVQKDTPQRSNFEDFDDDIPF